jgi:hypothetical protein
MKEIPAYVAKQYALQKKDGLETVTLQGAAADKFLETARETGWADVKKKMPKQYQKLRELLD